MNALAAILLAAALVDPLFPAVAQADAVVVGTPTAIRHHVAGDVWTAALDVDAVWLGAVRPGELRVAVPDPAGPAVSTRSWQPPLTVGRRAVFVLLPGDGLPRLVGYRSAPPPDSPDGELVRQACRAVADPLAGLTAPTADGRYLAASVLVERYAQWRPAQGYSCFGQPYTRYVIDGPPSVPVPADVSRLILRALAERTDWATAPPGLRPPADVFADLGLTAADGWTWSGADPSSGDDPPPHPVPSPSDRLVETVRDVLYPWSGPLDFHEVATAVRVHLTRQAFDHWLTGPGPACRLRTTGGGLRPTTPGGWEGPWPWRSGSGSMRPEGNR